MVIFAAETAIAARLAGLPELRQVASVAQLGQLGERGPGPQAPAAYLAPDGFDVLDTGPDGHVARVRVRWMVVVAVRHAAQESPAGALREHARGPVDAVLAALMGWEPAGLGFLGPLRLARGEPARVEPGYLLVPLVFTADQVVGAP